MLLTEDYPHPVPTRAKLRWRENWLYFLLDPEQRVFVTAHMSLLPTSGVARYACNLVIDGERFSYAEQVACPEDLAGSRSLTLGPLRVDFVAPQQRIDVKFTGPRHSFEISLEATLPLFDYIACADAKPDEYSTNESVALGFGDFRHQNQTMSGTGTLEFGDGQPARALKGTGYRDHSWGMREDSLMLEHIWAWAVFPGKTMHVMRMRNRMRPALTVEDGYIGTTAGNVPLITCDADYSGTTDDALPASVRLVGVDPDGSSFAVKCDIANAFARNRFLSQQPGEQPYLMKHNFCPAVREDTGEAGIAMVEIGLREKAKDAHLSAGR